MKCRICLQEVQKYKECMIGKSLNSKVQGIIVCLKCCFAISSGKPEYLKKVKQIFNLDKEDILKTCEECLSKPPK